MKAGELNVIMGGEGAGHSIIDKINALSDDAYYICGTYYFGAVIMGKPVLNTISKDAEKEIWDRQLAAFDELLDAGFCYLDTERGILGYRSTSYGQDACSIIRQFDRRTDGVLG